MASDNEDTGSEPTDNSWFGRRPVLRALGAGGALSLASGVATAGGAEDDAEAENDEEMDEHGGEDEENGDDETTWPVDCPTVPCIDSAFGLPILGTDLLDAEVLEVLAPDHTVELRIAPAEVRPADSEPPLDFFFEPSGVHVQPGEIVSFEFVSPEHSVTAYHPAQGRQRRVPEGVAPFSSPVLPVDGKWLYAFPEEGVYDVFCAPHEGLGMAMRAVVGDEPDPDFGEVTEELRAPLPASEAVLAAPELDPENVVESGTISWFDLSVDFE